MSPGSQARAYGLKAVGHAQQDRPGHRPAHRRQQCHEQQQAGGGVVGAVARGHHEGRCHGVDGQPQRPPAQGQQAQHDERRQELHRPRPLQAGEVPEERHRPVGERRAGRDRLREAVAVGAAAGEHLPDGGLRREQHIAGPGRGREAQRDADGQQHQDGDAADPPAQRGCQRGRHDDERQDRDAWRRARLEQSNDGDDERQPDDQLGAACRVASGGSTPRSGVSGVRHAGRSEVPRSEVSRPADRRTRPRRSAASERRIRSRSSRSAMAPASDAICCARP